MKCDTSTFHGGNVWKLANQSGADLQEIIDFSANINPLGPSPKALEAIKGCLTLLQHYPEPSGDPCRSTLAEYLQVDAEQLLLGNGGTEFLYLLGQMFYQRRIIRLAPTFAEYGGGLDSPVVVEIPLKADDQFRLPVSAIIDCLDRGDLLFIGNPNNPTGTLYERDELREVVERAQHVGATVVIDEAFIDFLPDQHSHSMRDLVDSYENLIITGSLTKFFAIPALRLGYAVANAELIKQMKRRLPPWRVNLAALFAGDASLRDKRYIDQSLVYISREKQLFAEELRKIAGLRVYMGAANFLLIDGQGTGMQACDLYGRLLDYGIMIRVCDSFANLSPYYFRLAVRTREQNSKLLEGLRNIYRSDCERR